MHLIPLSTVGIFAVLVVVFVALFKKLASREPVSGIGSDLENLLSVEKYKPMGRLLDQADFKFLQSNRAYDRRSARRFRATRIQIFRGYARCLARDFARVTRALKVVMVHAQTDRSALAGVLLKQRLLFSANMMVLECRLVLCGIGMSAPSVNVQNLVNTLDAMGAQLRALALSAQLSAQPSAA